MSRERTGGMVKKGNRWYAQLTVDKDGVPIRVMRALGTDSKQVARAKLARLVNEEVPLTQAAEGETFEQAARRVVQAQCEAGMRTWKIRLCRLQIHVFPVLGKMSVKDIRARHITDLLQGVQVTAKSGETVAPARETLKHILSDVSVVLDEFWRKEQLTENVAKRVRIPKTQRRVTERAVLDDFELARYLNWQHPDERA